MLNEIVSIFTLPLIFYFLPALFLSRFNFYKKLDFLEKSIFNLSFFTFFLSAFLISYGYIFSVGFRLV
ncbi:MAG: hypothetical protein NC935_02895, partial [Candidatus Omnitrophica bacterium]|nr:hypothetical protein [Candidatus Omnitrophota bacterium]